MYHVNPNTGRVGQCRAKSAESCEFSIQEQTIVQHYDTPEDAQAAYEKLHKFEETKGLSKKKNQSPKRITQKAIKDYQANVRKINKNISENRNEVTKIDNALKSFEKLDPSLKKSVNLNEKALNEQRNRYMNKIHESKNELSQYRKDNKAIQNRIKENEKKKEEEKLRAAEARRRAYSYVDSCGAPMSC